LGKQLGLIFRVFRLGCDWEAIGINFLCIFVWDEQLGSIFNVFRLGFDWEAIGIAFLFGT